MADQRRHCLGRAVQRESAAARWHGADDLEDLLQRLTAAVSVAQRFVALVHRLVALAHRLAEIRTEVAGETVRTTTLAYARLGYKLDARTKVSLDVFNLFNRKVSDIDYYYASLLRGEDRVANPNGINDIHSHPAEPRTVRLTLNVGF